MYGEDELYITIDEKLIKDIYSCLETGKDNAEEVLRDHIESFGETTIKNKRLAEMMREDARLVKSVIKQLQERFPFLFEEPR